VLNILTVLNGRDIIFNTDNVTDYWYYAVVDPRSDLLTTISLPQLLTPVYLTISAAYPCNFCHLSLFPASSLCIYRDSRAIFKIKSLIQFSHTCTVIVISLDCTTC